MNDRKKIGSVLFAGLVVLSAMVIFATPAVAQEVEDPVLWTVPENPTVYVGTNPDDDLLNETLIAVVDMGLSFSSNVFVLNQASYGNPKADAIEVNLTFFVLDNSSIQNITIGTAKRIINDTSPINPNNNSNPNVVTFQQADFAWMNQVPGPPGNGYYVRYLIGEIPFSGGPSVTGNYNGTEIGEFNLDAAWYYIEVPFTINFSTVPEQGFILYVYANNTIQGQDKAHTAWSHDGAFRQIPEFATIAIPVAAILGLLFFFSHRKKRGE